MPALITNSTVTVTVTWPASTCLKGQGVTSDAWHVMHDAMETRGICHACSPVSKTSLAIGPCFTADQQVEQLLVSNGHFLSGEQEAPNEVAHLWHNPLKSVRAECS